MKNVRAAQVAVLGLSLFGLLSFLFTSSPMSRTAKAFSSGPPAGHTGAPNEPTCTECHTGTADTGPGTFELISPSVYEPGQTYQITIRHTTTDTTRQEWGFQLTALKGSNNVKAGEFQNLNNLTQIDNTAINRQYIEHTFAGSFQGQRLGATWNVRWVAPDEDVGPVALYAAGNQANANGTTSGDQIYTAHTFILSGPPEITAVRVNGKKLIVTGRNFNLGAILLMDGNKVKKVSNDGDDPTGTLQAKKAGKTISIGQTVMLVVRNPDDSESDPFSFTREP
ncbi:MAG TPA: choice-of-anchor V domain-containing protein [Blastocatellia bacterium]|nr:choice-of-anchor V domain-containing protein [Blastocatellia bacterium]